MTTAKELYYIVMRTISPIQTFHLQPFTKTNLPDYYPGHLHALQLIGLQPTEIIAPQTFELYIKSLIAYRDDRKVTTLAALQQMEKCELPIRFEKQRINKQGLQGLLSVSSDSELQVLEEEFEADHQQHKGKSLYEKPKGKSGTICITSVEEGYDTVSKFDFNYRIVHNQVHVWRRESDFLELRTKLSSQSKLLGVVIPTLQSLGIMQKISISKFALALHTEHLQAFLTRLYANHNIKNNKLFKKFMNRGRFVHQQPFGTQTLTRLGEGMFNFSLKESWIKSKQKILSIKDSYFYKPVFQDDLPQNIDKMSHSLLELQGLCQKLIKFIKKINVLGTNTSLTEAKLEEMFKWQKILEEVCLHAREGNEVAIRCKNVRQERDNANIEYEMSSSLSQKDKKKSQLEECTRRMILAGRQAEEQLGNLLQNLQKKSQNVIKGLQNNLCEMRN